MAKNAATTNEVAPVNEAATQNAEAASENKTATAGTEAKEQKKASAGTGSCASGFYCYIGPSVAGVIKHGDLFFGSRADALEQAKAAIEKKPLVKTLIVSGDDLPAARLKVKTPGNALYANAQRVAARD